MRSNGEDQIGISYYESQYSSVFSKYVSISSDGTTASRSRDA